jgi:hypothetical protein
MVRWPWVRVTVSPAVESWAVTDASRKKMVHRPEQRISATHPDRDS